MQAINRLSEIHSYPASHWERLQRFITANERDPKNLFHLANDAWNAWDYTAHVRPSQAARYRFRFAHLHSFLKPYVKWYCYHRLIGDDRSLKRPLVELPYALTRVDRYLAEHSIESIDDIILPAAFAKLWEASLVLSSSGGEQTPYPARVVKIQIATRSFWEHIKAEFGAPQDVPPVSPYIKRRPVDFAADEQQVLPLPVIRQLTNKLALHREGKELLNRFDHLRLCVLVLALCVGRRIDEVLAAPRGTEPDGPLSYYPAQGESAEGALWFQFSPNKNGPQDQVYISPEWKNITIYCVQTLKRYGDEIREFADPREQDLLILVSNWNWTAGSKAFQMQARQQGEDLTMRVYEGRPRQRTWPVQRKARGLSYDSLHEWLNGDSLKNKPAEGILRRWNITEDGLKDSKIYHLRTHQARHTRQTALAKSPEVPLLARQRDLNHTSRDMQFAYQHVLREQNEALQQKAREGQLVGPALPWLADMLGTNDGQTEPQPRFKPGQPSHMSLRWRRLIEQNPQFVQFNRVDCGYCALPQGPQGCEEYMNCLEAAEGGCQWFVTDPEDEHLLIQITQRAHKHWKRAEESLAAGRTVQAGKYEVLAHRAEMIEGEVLQQASQNMRERLKACKRELEVDE